MTSEGGCSVRADLLIEDRRMAGEPPEKVQKGFRLLKWNEDQLNCLRKKDEGSRRDDE